MLMKMPKLVSFVIYDGIPPTEEGQDPTVFFYYPKSTPIDNQLNDVGLFLTFTGFSRDFHCSKDCEFCFTDRYLTVFSRMDSDICLAARFETSDPLHQRICIQSIKNFQKIYLMFFPTPERLPDGQIDSKTLHIFEKKIIAMITLFTVPPFLKKILPSFDLWVYCEQVFGDIKNENCHLKYGAILYDGNIILNSMPEEDLCNLHFCLQANLFGTNNPSNNSESFNFILKNQKKPLKLTTTNGFPFVFTYKQHLMVILIFSDFSSSFSSLTSVVSPLLEKIYKQSASILNFERGASPPTYHEANSKVIFVRPSSEDSLFGNQMQVEGFESFFQGTLSSFVEFFGKTGGDSWLMMEKLNPSSTLSTIQADSMNSAITNFTNLISATNFS